MAALRIGRNGRRVVAPDRTCGLRLLEGDRINVGTHLERERKADADVALTNDEDYQSR